MIEIACQTYSLRTRPLAEMLGCARKAGFRAVELWVGHADHAGGAAAAAAARSAAAEAGIAIHAYSVGGFVRSAVELVAAKLASAFAFADALGVDLLTGVVDRRAVPVVDRLCRETGLRFAIENHWYTDFARAEDYTDALAGTSPLVGVALDTGHLLASRQRPTTAFALLGDRVFDVHLKDGVIPARLERWLLRRPRIEPRTVGAGDADVSAFLVALAGRGYVGRLAIEDERPELPLSELQASLRAATGILRGVPQRAAQPGSVACTYSS
jgi:sugar phosphate isomerase/epimerase